MRLFFDTEFTGLHKNTTLISIGIVSEDGRKFYAELNDYDRSQVDDWIESNVINNLEFINDVDEEYFIRSKIDDDVSVEDKWNIQMRSNMEDLEMELRKWLSQFSQVQFVSDVCHYDFVLLIDIFGSAFGLPGHVSESCHDINQDIADYLGIPDRDAFSINREDFVNNHGVEKIENANKHNALYDAEIIKKCYEIVSYGF